jgi:hypothetical protein
MPENSWSCTSCRERNPPLTEVCRECGNPAAPANVSIPAKPRDGGAERPEPIVAEQPWVTARFLRVLGGILAGGFVAYETAAITLCDGVLCEILRSCGNLCGLPAALLAGPVGSMAGGIIAAEREGRRFAVFLALCLGIGGGELVGVVASQAFLGPAVAGADGACRVIPFLVTLATAAAGAFLALRLVPADRNGNDEGDADSGAI